jgi:hypothetical protein
MGIGLLIVSLIHVPLPQADYHNIRHHDGPGERCLYHDHLVRWHPSAEFDEDVALLHWHWFVPVVELGNPLHRTGDDDQRPGSGPAMHAHVGDSLQPDDWRSEPVLQPEGRGRVCAHLALAQSDSDSAHPSDHPFPFNTDPGRLCTGAASLGAGMRALRTGLLERWNC